MEGNKLLRNCVNCGKLHNDLSKYCKECLEKEKISFDKIRDYLHNNPNSTLEQVHKNTNIPRKKISEYIREDRLIVTNKGIID